MAGAAMFRCIFVALVLAFASPIAIGAVQERREVPPPARQGTGRIAGTVISAETGGPVRLAELSLTSSAGEFTATSDDAGGFSFEKLPSGAYTLRTSKPGFLDTVFGQTRPGTDTPGRRIHLKDREEITRLPVPLSRGGSISGIVRDDYGDPIFSANVRISRWVMRGGRRAIEEVASAQTDERGTFRAALLPSRQYVVSVSPPENMKSGDEAAPSVGFAPVFYPSATSAGNAETIALGVGEHRMNVGLVMPLVKLSKVTGIVLDANGHPMPEFPVSLVEQHSGMWTEQGTETEADGRFTFVRVTPGSYIVMAGERHFHFKNVEVEFHSELKGGLIRVVKAVEAFASDVYRVEKAFDEAPPMKRALGSASEEVSVAGEAPLEVILRLIPPRDVTGRVMFEGASRKPTTQIEVTLRPALDTGGTYVATVADDGTFTVKDVAPGRYFAEVTGPEKPWSLASAMSAGIETLDFQLEVPRDRDVLDLGLTFRDRRAELSGAVTDALTQPVNDRRVIVFSSDERLWTTAKDRIHTALLTEAGRFSFDDLRPGSYWLGVVGDVEPDEWLLPEFLRQLTRAAAPITLGEGEKKTQDLRVK